MSVPDNGNWLIDGLDSMIGVYTLLTGDNCARFHGKIGCWLLEDGDPDVTVHRLELVDKHNKLTAAGVGDRLVLTAGVLRCYDAAEYAELRAVVLAE